MKEAVHSRTASVRLFLVVTQISCTWANIINLNTCHTGTPSCETTAALLVFKYECHCNEMDIAKTEDKLSGAYTESTDFIMETGLQPNWHNEVNPKVSDICSASYQWSLYFFPQKSYFRSHINSSFWPDYITTSSWQVVMMHNVTKDMQKNRLNITIDHCPPHNEVSGCVNRPSDAVSQVTSQTSQA